MDRLYKYYTYFWIVAGAALLSLGALKIVLWGFGAEERVSSLENRVAILQRTVNDQNEWRTRVEIKLDDLMDFNVKSAHEQGQIKKALTELGRRQETCFCADGSRRK